MPETFSPTERTRVVREPHRGSYDRETIYKILDEGFVCHVGFSMDGQPYVIPTLFARVGDVIYFHGSAASPAAAVLWSRRAVDLCRVATCLCLAD